MRAHFGLPSVECEDSEGKPPIQVRFEIPYFTTSGIQVRNRPLGTAQTLSCVKGYEYLFYSFIILSLPISTSLLYSPSPPLSNIQTKPLFVVLPGEVPENYREVRLSSFTLGAIHHPEWRLPVKDTLEKSIALASLCSLR